MNTAQTILQQIGGIPFTVMTGARGFAADKNALLFRLPSNFAKNGINAIRINLEADDTYTIEYSKVRGTSVKSIATSSGIYCDMLQRDFTATTGLDTHL